MKIFSILGVIAAAIILSTFSFAEPVVDATKSVIVTKNDDGTATITPIVVGGSVTTPEDGPSIDPVPNPEDPEGPSIDPQPNPEDPKPEPGKPGEDGPSIDPIPGDKPDPIVKPDPIKDPCDPKVPGDCPVTNPVEPGGPSIDPVPNPIIPGEPGGGTPVIPGEPGNPGDPQDPGAEPTPINPGADIDCTKCPKVNPGGYWFEPKPDDGDEVGIH